MRGVLIPVVGPSGAGKDSLIDAARIARPDIFIPIRVITRPETAGGEIFQATDTATFDAMLDKGAFAFYWRAHGLAYGIPHEIETRLKAGQHVMFNGSRGIIDQARARFENLCVMVVTASDDVLAKRLAMRGREDAGDIANRLKRAAYAPPAGADVRVIQNNGPIEDACARFLAELPSKHEGGSVS